MCDNAIPRQEHLQAICAANCGPKRRAERCVELGRSAVPLLQR
jgi:hypothetical protein